MPSNPFATDTAAHIYAAGRPDCSELVSNIIRRIAGVLEPVPYAVDVGSGTGISTMALAPLARTVIGVEPSPAMLKRARQAGNVTYRLGSAELLPVEDRSCDLIGVGSRSTGSSRKASSVRHLEWRNRMRGWSSTTTGSWGKSRATRSSANGLATSSWRGIRLLPGIGHGDRLTTWEAGGMLGGSNTTIEFSSARTDWWTTC